MPGQDSLSPQAGVPSPWRLQPPSLASHDVPTTALARPPVTLGWCARALKTVAPLARP